MEIFRHYKYLPHVILRTYTPCLVIGNLIDSERCLGPKCISNENIRKNHLNLRKRCIVKAFGKCYMCYCWLYLKKDSNQHALLLKLLMKSTSSSFRMRSTCNLYDDFILNKAGLNSMRRALPFYESYLRPIKS